MTYILPDVLNERLVIVFCGTAASTKSAEIGAYYGNPSNAFWRTLHTVGMTPRQLDPVEFRLLLDYGIGLTDIAKGAVGNDSDLTLSDFDADALTAKLKRYQPQIIAFTSKRAYRAWKGFSANQRVQYGWQDDRIGQTRIYVLTSPSGAARGYWDLDIWQVLAETYQQLREQHGIYD